MSTSVSSDIEIRPPWKSFYIELPVGLLWIRNDAQERRDIVGVLASISDDGNTWYWEALIQEGDTTLFGHARLFENAKESEGEFASSAFDIGIGLHEERVCMLIQRTIANVCLAVTDPSNVSPGNKVARTGSSRGARFPLYRIYRLGRRVDIDCRAALASYLTGERRDPLAVQFLVRGHWRNQACGPALTERKTIWIEPYWKGSEGAPINMRPHMLKS